MLIFGEFNVFSPADVRGILDKARQNLEAPEISCPSATPSKDCFRDQAQLYAQGQGLDLLGTMGHGAIGLTAIAAGVGLLLDDSE